MDGAAKKEFARGLFAGLIFLVLALSNPAFAYPLEGGALSAHFADTNPIAAPGSSLLTAGAAASNPGTGAGASDAGTGTQPAVGTNPNLITSSSGCTVSRLSPLEAKDIMNLASEGFSGKNVSAGNDTNKPGISLEGAEIIGKDSDGKTAVKQEPPAYGAFADKYSFFNNRTIGGPWGIGLVLDDTLRVGQCKTDQAKCRVEGKGLNYRTDGTGFIEDIANASSAIKDAAYRAANGLSEEDAVAIQNEMFDVNTDGNSLNMKTGSFKDSGNKIPNSILAETYSARSATTCNNNACAISTYSAFDKYYNSWMSTDLAVSNLAPAFVGKAGKIMTRMYKVAGGVDTPGALGKAIRKALNSKAYNNVVTPKYLLGKDFQYYNALIKEEGFGNILKPLTIEGKLFSSGGGGAIDDMLAPNSPIWKLSRDQKTKFFEAVNHLAKYTRGNMEYVEGAKAAYAAGTISKVEYGQAIAKYLNEWDDTVFLDAPQWIKQNDELFGFGGLAMKRNGYPADQGFVDVTSAASFNFKKAQTNFAENGGWRNWAGSTDSATFAVDATGNLKVYKTLPDELAYANVAIADLKGHVAKVGQGFYTVKLPDGRTFPLTNETISYLESSPAMPGVFSIYKSKYSEVIDPATGLPQVITPDDFANRLTHSRLTGRPTTAMRNMEDLRNALVQKDFMERKSMSYLDSLYAKEGDVIKSYYSNPLKGVVNGTLLPMVYWQAKKGFGINEKYSAYMLPDSWSTMTMAPGTDAIYADSFTDFFANAGSDQGDMFKRAFNSFPLIWNKVVQMAADFNPTLKTMVSKYSGGFFEEGSTGGKIGSSPMRDEAKDLAYYSHNENCSGCSTQLNLDEEYFKVNGFSMPVASQAFVLEAADAATKSKEGTTIISYTHHTNLSGKTADIEGEGINIVEGRASGATCDQKLRELHLGWAGNAAGGVLAIAENATYLFGVGYGLTFSILTQMLVGRTLQDCVDDVEGYYVHFYVPAEGIQSASKAKETISNETVSNALGKMSESVGNLASSKEGPVGDALTKIKDQFAGFSNAAKNNNVLQATIETSPPSSGELRGKQLFYFWCKECVSMPSGYSDTGKTVVKDGDKTLEFNNESGQLMYNGKQLLGADKADHTRLATTPVDARIPAIVVPVTLNKIGAPNTPASVFELSAYGEVKVANPEVLACVRQAVKDQSGIDYSGDELTQVFGKLTGISTEGYGNIFARDGKIYLEGSGPRYQGGVTSKFIIDGFWSSRLVEADANKTLDAGKFSGMTFEHGTIVLKKETNELIIWLRQHKDAVLSNKEVAGLKGNLTTVTDPETGCTQPAINLEAMGYPNDQLGQQKVANFNTSMNHLGPFTQFVTDGKIYEFYSKRDGNTGECKDYFRVIDKATGKVLEDSEIVGGVKQDADGTISFKTADGKTHTLDFSAENGVPKLSYNGGAPETLRSAQGPNGSFWYDPNTGLWYPENGLQIPMDQAMKDQGFVAQGDKSGNVSGTAGNPMTFNMGGQQGSGFNIPSLPETAAGLVLFIAAYLMVSFALTRRKEPKKKGKLF